MRWWKARNFREQEQLWRCATLTTSFEMLPGSASIQGPLSIGCPHGGSGRRLKYERALVIACPILLSFAHHCGISAERSATCCFQRGHFPNKSAKKTPRKRGAFS